MLPATSSATLATHSDCAQAHAVFWATSTSTPVALASPGGELIYTNSVLPGYHALNGAGNMVGYAYNADFSAERAVFWATDEPGGDSQNSWRVYQRCCNGHQ